jgi:hypothetical protein
VEGESGVRASSPSGEGEEEEAEVKGGDEEDEEGLDEQKEQNEETIVDASHAMGVTVPVIEAFARSDSALRAVPTLLSRLDFTVSKIEVAHQLEMACVPLSVWREFMVGVKATAKKKAARARELKKQQRVRELEHRSKRQKRGQSVQQAYYDAQVAQRGGVQNLTAAEIDELWTKGLVEQAASEKNNGGRVRRRRAFFGPFIN